MTCAVVAQGNQGGRVGTGPITGPWGSRLDNRKEIGQFLSDPSRTERILSHDPRPVQKGRPRPVGENLLRGTHPILDNGKLRSHVVESWAFDPAPLPPNVTLEEVTGAAFDELIAAERSLARLDGVGEDLPNAMLLWAPLANREAILSSKIENTIASATELASLEAGKAPERQEVQEVANYVKALNHGLKSDLPICQRLIREMHEVLLSGRVRGGDTRPGRFRDVQNYIGNEDDGFSGARFVPPPPSTLQQGLDDFDEYANRKNFGIPKIAAIALMHYQFEALHPFRDGNGRIGRLVSALSLCRMRLLKQPFVYLSGFFEPRRDQYNDLMLAVSTDGAWIDWIVFFMKAVAWQAQDAEDRVRSLRNLRTKYRTQLHDSNAPGKILWLVDSLFAHPGVRADRAATELDVSKPTARAYIRRLEDMGALVEIGDSKKKLWVAKEILDLIDAPPKQG